MTAASLHTDPARRPAGLPARLAGLAAALGRALLAHYLAFEDRRAVKRLVAVDDRMLADIGLSRGDVLGAMTAVGTDLPSLHLARAAAERRAGERAQAAEARRRAVSTEGGARTAQVVSLSAMR